MSSAHEHLSYVAQGRYAVMLERWFAAFPRDQVLILMNEDFDRDRDETLDRLFAFLELPGWQPPRLERYNFHPESSDGILPPGRNCSILFQEDNRRLERLLGTDLRAWTG